MSSPGETQALIPKSYEPSYFPVPPPSARDNTCYSGWEDFDCVCANLPFWEQDPSRRIRWAAKAYDWRMIPGYDRFIKSS